MKIGLAYDLKQEVSATAAAPDDALEPPPLTMP